MARWTQWYVKSLLQSICARGFETAGLTQPQRKLYVEMLV